jgi:transcriptional regulator with XRE-family HTH domain
MGAHAKGDRTQAELAKLAGVTVRTIREWEKEGVDVYDLQSLMARASKVREREAATEDLAGVKLRKLKAEADLKEHELQVERGLFVSKDEVVTEGVRMGIVIKGIMLKLSSDLTPILAGRPAGEIKKVLDKYAREKLTELSLYDSPIKITAD